MDSGRSKRQEEVLRVAEQAAEWLVQLEDGETAHYPQLAEWLLESPLHTQMFLRAAAIDRHAAALHPKIRDALKQGMTGEADGNIVSLRVEQRKTPTGAATTPARPQRRFMRFSVAALLAIVAAGIVGLALNLGLPKSYRTEVGEQRTFDLEDGSVVYLNARSRIEVAFDAQARDLRLVEGEALFSVRRDPARPFRVHVGDTTVQAIGTQFNVYRREKQTTVAVLEGVVEISRPEQQPARVSAGETATMSSAGRIENRDRNVVKATAWRQRQLVFEWAPLSEIAAEFNRYNRTPQLRIEDAAIGNRRYTAVFNADDPELLMQFLSQDPALKFVSDGDTFVIQQR